MGAIFISYRREDTEGHAGRLFEDLVERFGRQAVFFDVSGIAPGQDFRAAIDANVARCSVLLAMIGPRWLEAKSADGRRRIDDPGDFVRIETASALKRGIPVVPVLVQAAKMPAADTLPADLAELVFRNAVELTHARWESDVQVLAQGLAAYVGSAPSAAHAAAALAPSAPPTTTRGGKGLWLMVAGLLLVAAIGGWALMRAPGDDGERARLAPLVNQMNDADAAQRRVAVTRLIAEHRRSQAAVELAVDQLAEKNFQRLSREGRANVLSFLVESDLSAWSAAQRSEVRAAVARIQQRLAAGASLGNESNALLRQLDEKLAR